MIAPSKLGQTKQARVAEGQQPQNRVRRRHQKREDVRWEEVTDFTPVDIPFNEVPGPSHPMQVMTPLNILMMFFTTERSRS